MCSMPSRYCVTVKPESSVCSVWATSWGVRPSARARSWSTSSRIDFTCSLQSRCGSTILAFVAMICRTSSAIARTFIGSGPTTRNCTGKPTGGPNRKRSTRARASGRAPSAISRSSRALTRSRAARSLVTMTIWAKFGFGSTGLRPSQKRGEPCPTGGIGHDIRIAGEETLGPLCARVGHADRRALRQAHLEEQLRARRGREELLLDQGEPCDRTGEHQYREGNDGLAPAQAPSDHAAQRAINASVIDRVRVLLRAEPGEIGQ